MFVTMHSEQERVAASKSQTRLGSDLGAGPRDVAVWKRGAGPQCFPDMEYS